MPSLFTFEIDDPRLRGLAGVAVPLGRVQLDGANEAHEGPLLVTHWGLSWPAVLRASAWGARLPHDQRYRLALTVYWRPALPRGEVAARLLAPKADAARRPVIAGGPLGLPQRPRRSLAVAAGAREDTHWADASKALLASLAREVRAGRYEISGKGAFKEEFVTCGGGVGLQEVDFTTMESRLRLGLHLAGEILDVDGIPGGFNFQRVWTTGWLPGRAMATGA